MATTLVLEKKNLSSNGLWDLSLKRYSSTGYLLDEITVNSGQPWNQVFQRAGAGLPGNFAPIEEGEWSLGPLEWAGAPGNLNASWGPGLGPTWVGIEKGPNNHSRRADFGIHLDANRSTSPGSAGCVVVKNLEDLQHVIRWFEDSQYGPPNRLLVNWRLGSVNTDKVDNVKTVQYKHYKVFANLDKDGKPKISVFDGNKKAQSSLVKIFANMGTEGMKLSVILNNKDIDWTSVTLDIVTKE